MAPPEAQLPGHLLCTLVTFTSLSDRSKLPFFPVQGIGCIVLCGVSRYRWWRYYRKSMTPCWRRADALSWRRATSVTRFAVNRIRCRSSNRDISICCFSVSVPFYVALLTSHQSGHGHVRWNGRFCRRPRSFAEKWHCSYPEPFQGGLCFSEGVGKAARTLAGSINGAGKSVDSAESNADIKTLHHWHHFEAPPACARLSPRQDPCRKLQRAAS